MKTVDVAIIGAGAAGMMCAIEAGRRGRSVLLIDHAKAAGEKIRISGGGRCNFTNMSIAPDNFLSQNPRFALSALKRFTQWDFIDRVAEAGIAYHEKTLGQLFCDGSSKQIIAMLHRHMAEVDVELKLETGVSEISGQGPFELGLSTGERLGCSALVIASGGKSIPKMGATGFGYDVARQFGLPLTEIRPALVPLTFEGAPLERMKSMAGLSVDAKVSVNGTAFQEGFLFTHRGLSGPSILQCSSYWKEGDVMSVDLFPNGDVALPLRQERQRAGRPDIQTSLSEFLPKKLSGFVVENSGLTGNLADQSDADLVNLSDAVHCWVVKPAGSEGYRTAEVTLGGVDTDCLNSKTMQVKSVPGLYFIGEVVDVTGWLGGYNFQWAWSSGWAAGQVV